MSSFRHSEPPLNAGQPAAQPRHGDAADGSLTIPNYPKNFCIYDRNYSGVVDACDHPLTPDCPGDMDGDGDVDFADAEVFLSCLNGPDVTTPPPGCDPADFETADLDEDGDADLADFAAFQRFFTG